MPRFDRRNALDHVVVVMFENRSFDNLLGRLYQPGEVASFEGVIGKELSNPVPDWARNGTGPQPCPMGSRPPWTPPIPTRVSSTSTSTRSSSALSTRRPTAAAGPADDRAL